MSHHVARADMPRPNQDGQQRITLMNVAAEQGHPYNFWMVHFFNRDRPQGLVFTCDEEGGHMFAMLDRIDKMNPGGDDVVVYCLRLEKIEKQYPWLLNNTDKFITAHEADFMGYRFEAPR